MRFVIDMNILEILEGAACWSISSSHVYKQGGLPLAEHPRAVCNSHT